MRREDEGWGMSSYASYCQDQSTDCARRARLACSEEVATYWLCLGLRWRQLAEQAQGPDGARQSVRCRKRRTDPKIGARKPTYTAVTDLVSALPPGAPCAAPQSRWLPQKRRNTRSPEERPANSCRWRHE